MAPSDRELAADTQPAQPISHNGQQATTPINTAQLADIAELLDILDGFLRHADDIADRLADYLHTTGRDHPQPPARSSPPPTVDHRPPRPARLLTGAPPSRPPQRHPNTLVEQPHPPLRIQLTRCPEPVAWKSAPTCQPPRASSPAKRSRWPWSDLTESAIQR
jgi:hypothetical protein